MDQCLRYKWQKLNVVVTVVLVNQMDTQRQNSWFEMADDTLMCRKMYFAEL